MRRVRNQMPRVLNQTFYFGTKCAGFGTRCHASRIKLFILEATKQLLEAKVMGLSKNGVVMFTYLCFRAKMNSFRTEPDSQEFRYISISPSGESNSMVLWSSSISMMKSSLKGKMISAPPG